MGEIRFLLDENVDPIFRRALIEREPELTVWRVGDPGAPPLGASDPKILRWCEERGFLLITNDRQTMPQHVDDHLAEGRHVAGVVQLSPKVGIGELLDDLVLIWAATEPADHVDQIIYLPLR